MLEFIKVFYSLFLAPWKSVSDVESIFEGQHRSPRICAMLWKEVNHQHVTWLSDEQRSKSLQFTTDCYIIRSIQVG